MLTSYLGRVLSLGGILMCCSSIISYDQPYLNLGFNNILNGGPLRPTPWFYWYQYFRYFDAGKLLNAQGDLLGGVTSPHFNSCIGITELIYQFDSIDSLNGQFGLDMWISYGSMNIKPNNLGFVASGHGFGDILGGIYFQGNPIMRQDKPVFVHRLELLTVFPTGRYKKNYFNVGDGIYYLSPFWAATFYMKPSWALSWCLNYNWLAKNKHTGIQAGQSLVTNFSLEFECVKDFWVALTGYYLQQLSDSRKNGVNIPQSRERALGIGPGVLYKANEKVDLIGYVHFDTKVRNRPQGISYILRSVVLF